MIINGKELDVNDLANDINSDDKMMKMRGNGIYLSDNDEKILKKYDINYTKYNSLSNLIFDIEEILNEEELTDLEEVSNRLSEINYYNNTNK